MGYFVSPSGGDVAAVTSSVNAQMKLSGKYVNTGSSSVSRTVSSVETVNLSLSNKTKTKNLKNTKSNLFASMGVTGADIYIAYTSPTATEKSTLDFTNYYSSTHTTIEKANAFSCAVIYGFVDIWEALVDGVIGLFLHDLAARDFSGEARDSLDQTGVDVNSAYKVGQTLGRVTMCVVILGIAAAIITAPISITTGAIICGVFGAVVGIGLGIEKGYAGIRLAFASLSEALNFAAIGAGIGKAKAALCNLEGSLLNNFIQNLRSIPRVSWSNFQELKSKPFKYLAKALMDFDADNILKVTKDTSVAWLNFITKFGKDALDIAVGFFFDGNGLDVLKKWVIGKGFSFVNDITGGTNIVTIITARFKSQLQGADDRYAVVNTIVSKILAVLSFFFKDYKPA